MEPASHVLGPLPSGLIDGATEGQTGESYDLEPALFEHAHLIGLLEAAKDHIQWRHTVQLLSDAQRPGVYPIGHFDSHPRPKTPRDLTASLHGTPHERGHHMSAHGTVYRWEFEKRGKLVTISVTGRADRRFLSARLA
jgi:hypothetical protein